MPFQPGVVTNPKGGKPGPKRTLAGTLRGRFDELIEVPGKGEMTGHEALAMLIHELLFYGRVTLLNGERYTADLDQWIDIAKWASNRMYGRPALAPQDPSVSGIGSTVVFMPRNGRERESSELELETSDEDSP